MYSEMIFILMLGKLKNQMDSIEKYEKTLQILHFRVSSVP